MSPTDSLLESKSDGGSSLYIYRHAEQILRELGGHFGAALVTGPRQVGKTTLIEEGIMKGGRETISRVSLDDPLMLEAARDEGGRFFLDHRPPVFVDEVQYAPELFPYIKMIADREKKPGLFYLTGSQQFQMMKNVSESLAGRIGIINILGLSLREIGNDRFTEPFCPTGDYINVRRENPPRVDYDRIWEFIWRGAMPRLYADPGLPVQAFYASYLRTYIERDVHAIVHVGDEKQFLSFIRGIAARTGQILNLTKLAEDTGISRGAAERWLSILVSSGLVFLLRPFYANIGKREIKAPKIYFLDTGLAAWLIGWDNPRVLRNGAMGGAFFESFAVAEIIKSYLNRGVEAPLYYYRDKENREIDLLIYRNGLLHPLEIKMTASPGKTHIRAFSVLDSLAPPYGRGEGGFICHCEEPFSLTPRDRVIPADFL
jgi:predicted AAA+ superfamily ATPase